MKQKLVSLIVLIFLVLLFFGCSNKNLKQNDLNDLNLIINNQDGFNVRDNLTDSDFDRNTDSNTFIEILGDNEVSNNQLSQSIICDKNYPIKLVYDYEYNHELDREEGVVKYYEDKNSILFLRDYFTETSLGKDYYVDLRIVEKESGKLYLFNKSKIYGEISCTGRLSDEIISLKEANSVSRINTCRSDIFSYSCPLPFLRESVISSNKLNVDYYEYSKGKRLPLNSHSARAFPKFLEYGELDSELKIVKTLTNNLDYNYTCLMARGEKYKSTCIDTNICLNVGVFSTINEIGGKITFREENITINDFFVPNDCPTIKQVELNPSGITIPNN